MAQEIMLQMLLCAFFLSDLGQQFFRAQSPSAEYHLLSYMHERKPKVRLDCSFFGCILLFVLTWSFHCASSKVKNSVKVAPVVEMESSESKRGVEMFSRAYFPVKEQCSFAPEGLLPCRTPSDEPSEPNSRVDVLSRLLGSPQAAGPTPPAGRRCSSKNLNYRC